MYSLLEILLQIAYLGRVWSDVCRERSAFLADVMSTGGQNQGPKGRAQTREDPAESVLSHNLMA